MCSKPTRSSLRLRSKRKNANSNTKSTISSTTTTSTKRPSRRKTRTKTRKHKYISLQRDLSSNDSSTINSPESAESTHQQLLNFFKEEEKEEENNNVVAYNFFDCTQETTSLNGLIGCTTAAVVLSSEEGGDSRVCPSLTYGYSDGGGTSLRTTTSSLELERSALRGGGGGGEREVREEKWVCYEEVTSCTVPSSDEYGIKKVIKKESGEENGSGRRRLLLSLKLDYDEIMNAWSDKGPFYINHQHHHGVGDESQIVPDLLDDILGWRDSGTTNNVFLDVGNVPLLRVPEDGDSVMDGADGEVWKLAHREARVLRYKEKRQNRLFSKRIRYEVRKLNAEKRPRIKGRFVKRS
ncbi:hypothetical protein AQUCO_05600072v1 [Aquilegia coerulea]|uniref:CCT domain-containing protein n=1 Tax=Aquilegia coerulea TaxID=218851 RepID=A0A2G5CGL1_AQUCA|nr:hypothetical protein AQUCO_05600072v1 [Aquilegia coerulea]